MTINQNKLASEITKEEGLKKSLSVAQVKEVLKLTLKKLSSFKPSEVLATLEKMAGKK